MPTLQIRKIYQSSRTSCAVTLPLEWLRFLGLRAGDEVEMMVDGDLTIRPRQRPIEQKTIGGMLLKGLDHNCS